MILNELLYCALNEENSRVSPSDLFLYVFGVEPSHKTYMFGVVLNVSESQQVAVSFKANSVAHVGLLINFVIITKVSKLQKRILARKVLQAFQNLCPSTNVTLRNK